MVKKLRINESNNKRSYYKLQYGFFYPPRSVTFDTEWELKKFLSTNVFDRNPVQILYIADETDKYGKEIKRHYNGSDIELTDIGEEELDRYSYTSIENIKN